MNKLWVLQRDEVMGVDIGTKKQYVVQGWEFILSKIDSRNWAFWIVPASLKWAIITWDFLAYDINTELVDMDFFLAFISLNNFERICAQASSGTTNRQRLSEPKFLNFEIQIPATIWEQKGMMKKYFEYKKGFTELKNISDKNEKLIKSLRSSILQDAIQWKLVPQDPSDEAASILIEKIQAEKTKLIAEWKLKKQKPLAPIKPEEIPYELPNGWTWVRLGEIVLILWDWLHWTPYYSDKGEYFFINWNNLSGWVIEIKSNTKRVSEEEYFKYSKELNERTIFVSINWTLWNVAFYNWEKIILGKSACYFNLGDLIAKGYIKRIIESTYFMSYAIRESSWTTIKNLWLKAMNDFPIPLPPAKEQVRIVEKVNELMKSCELLDEQVKQAKERSEKLMESVLQGVFNW